MKVPTPEAHPKVGRGTKSAKKGTSWGSLEPGQVVTLEKGNHRITGSIDALTEDGHILWIISSTGERRLFHIDDAYALFTALPEPS